MVAKQAPAIGSMLGRFPTQGSPGKQRPRIGLHPPPRLTPFKRITACSRAFAVAATLGLTAHLVPTPAVAQGEFPSSANQSREGSTLQQVTSPSDGKNPTPAASPAPAQEKSGSPGSGAIPFHSLEIKDAQSSSQDGSQASQKTSNSAMTPAPHTRPSHRTLGTALAIAGIAALVAGAALYVGEQHAYCNGSSTGCSEARDTGIALMPIGGAVAVTGFYLRFHR